MMPIYYIFLDFLVIYLAFYYYFSEHEAILNGRFGWSRLTLKFIFITGFFAFYSSIKWPDRPPLLTALTFASLPLAFVLYDRWRAR